MVITRPTLQRTIADRRTWPSSSPDLQNFSFIPFANKKHCANCTQASCTGRVLPRDRRSADKKTHHLLFARLAPLASKQKPPKRRRLLWLKIPGDLHRQNASTKCGAGMPGTTVQAAPATANCWDLACTSGPTVTGAQCPPGARTR